MRIAIRLQLVRICFGIDCTFLCMSILNCPCVWDWVRLHSCCTLSNQCAQVKPAVTITMLQDWIHRV